MNATPEPTDDRATPPAGPGPDPVASARLHVVLVEPEIAGNTGAIGRTCVAVGAMLWLVRPLGFHISDRHRRRAGLDYWEHLAWRAVDSFAEIEAALGPDRLWLTSTRAESTYTQARFQPGDALVFGPESRGLSPRLLEQYAARTLRIPIRPQARSLNLSTAVAISLFEAVRQLDAGRAGSPDFA